jgi:hypothetical protein
LQLSNHSNGQKVIVVTYVDFVDFAKCLFISRQLGILQALAKYLIFFRQLGFCGFCRTDFFKRVSKNTSKYVVAQATKILTITL